MTSARVLRWRNPLVQLVLMASIVLSMASPSFAVEVASIFLTGHDPDFHATAGNTTGARNINNAAIDFIMDPAFNPFVADGISKFLFVESNPLFVPGGHLRGIEGIIASGFTSGVDFDRHTAVTLDDALDQLGTSYSAIVVASDFGGLLTQDELDILNTRSTDIIDFLNSGGGLYALAESNGGSHLTPGGGHFGFLPFVVTSTAFDQSEFGITLTPFGASLGLADTDVNGNFSHNIFLDDFGLSVVDFDRFGQILSLAGRGRVGDDIGADGVVPEPSSLGLMGLGLAGLAFRRRRKGV